MRIIAVDDEPHALRNITRVIESEMPDCKLSSFDTAEEALEFAQGNPVDVAFLDIEMSGMNGLLLAKRLKDLNGKINIVFLTGYSEYALDAHSLHPAGFLMKPLLKESFRTAMKNLRHPVSLTPDKLVYVQTFGNFEIFADGKPVRFPRSKSKELLAYLVHKEGTTCTMSEIAATLFENNPQTNIRPYISAMIKALESAGIGNMIIKNFNSIAVDTGKFDCDLYRFLKRDPAAVNAYKGEYLANYSWGEFVAGYLDGKINDRAP